MQVNEFTALQQTVLSSLPRGEFEGIFFNVCESRACNALISAGAAGSNEHAIELLDDLVEKNYLKKHSRSRAGVAGAGGGIITWFHEPLGAIHEYATEFDYVLERFRHEIPKRGSLEGKHILVENGVLMSKHGGMVIDWCDERYFNYLTRVVKAMPCSEYAPLMREWGFGEAICCPFATKRNRMYLKDRWKEFSFNDKNTLPRFEAFLAEHGRTLEMPEATPPVPETPGSDSDTSSRATSTRATLSDDEYDEDTDAECSEDEEGLDKAPEDFCVTTASPSTTVVEISLLQPTYEVDDNAEINPTASPLNFLFNAARAQRERARLVEYGYSQKFINGLVPIASLLTPPQTAATVAAAEVIANIPQMLVRWGIRAVPCLRHHHFLRLLHDVNDERMCPNLTHHADDDPVKPFETDPGIAILTSFLKKLPLENTFVLHDNLLHLRNSMGMLRNTWFRQRIDEDAKSIRRRLRVELWELRYPGWLIEDVVVSLGATLFTAELEHLLEEITVARFPALKHVPDTIRADVLITFGRTEPMNYLLLLMEKLIPNYALRGGRLSASPCAVICPAFIFRDEFHRTSCEWNREGEEGRWRAIRVKLIEARNAAVRRILDVPGYYPSEAPW
ncbi:Hypothetical protein, putative [Bodo saltans]|uniref:Uncharacterized protein n=1 Tax=Bodo saltans TaxID=75058 RepID=A0A0S4INJ0_BODSA|nr:Hypothetical protein, putative [Bodo saltans]|eukprot:CUE79332.1 Hypothetical protein, putative [Bodo saltans]